MGKKLAYVYDDLYMFVDESVQTVYEETRCIVLDSTGHQRGPEIPVGCWTCRMGPWLEPTEEQKNSITLKR